MYDKQCEDLAEAFLDDSPIIATEAIKAKHLGKLAQLIQDTIEGYLAFDVELDAPQVSANPNDQ
jgi:hypothetical protein